MKKRFLIFAAIFAVHTANAQYFHSLYDDYSVIGNGTVVRTTGTGHLLGGATTNPPIGSAPVQSLVVTRTDVDGNFTSPANFNNVYMIYDGATGIQTAVTNVRIIEFSNGSGYGALGSYSFMNGTSPVNGLLYMTTDPNGNVLSVTGYINGAGSGSTLTLSSVTESGWAPGEIFAVGRQWNPATAIDNIFAMRVDNAGNLVWARLYNYTSISTAFQATVSSVLESPYAPELSLVGSINQNGLWIVLDPATGAAISADEYDLGGDESFSAIAVSNDPAAGGFILSGSSNIFNGSNYQMMAMKTDPSRNTTWMNTYGGVSTGTDQKGIHIACRLNTLSKYEYYMVGQNYAAPGSISGIQAFKINDVGNGVSFGLFEYAIPGSVDIPASIDVNDNAPGTGISIYSTNYSPKMDMHITTAYFNGISSCYDRQTDPATNNYSPRIKKLKGTVFSVFKKVPLLASPPYAYNDLSLCYLPSVPGGSNMKQTPTDNNVQEANAKTSVYPNPLLHDQGIINIAINSSEEDNLRVNLYDMLGRCIYNHTYALAKGGNQLQTDLTRLQPASGIYNLTLSTGRSTENHKITIE